MKDLLKGPTQFTVTISQREDGTPTLSVTRESYNQRCSHKNVVFFISGGVSIDFGPISVHFTAFITGTDSSEGDLNP